MGQPLPDMEFIDKHSSNEAHEKKAAALASPSTAPPALPGPFDSGWLPWLQVIGSFAAWTNSWGLYNSFGEFQTYYHNKLLIDKSADQIAWIGSLQAFLLLFLGTIAGILYDRGYFRVLIIAGNFLVVLGMMMTSLCTQYWQFVLAQGIVVGSGFGFLFVPCTAFVPQWFNERRSLANGLAASGSGFGGVIYTIIFRTVEPQLGFGWATRIVGFVAMLMAILMLITVRSKTPKAPRIRKLIQWQAFKEKPYWIYSLALLLAFLGIYTPWFFIGQYAITKDISTNTTSYLVVIINTGSIIGRIGLSFIADKTSMIDVAAGSLLCSGILVLSWIAIGNTIGLIIFALLYGIFAGSFLGICALVTVQLSKERMSTLGTRIGQLCMLGALSVLVGTPISGTILGSHKGFLGLQIFSGIAILVAAAAVVASRMALVGFILRAR